MTNLTQSEISHSIGLSRILLIVGLVFLHYGNFPNSEISPFRGMDLNAHSFATWLNSAVLFFFFSAVPLLSMVSGWLFFSFKDDAKTALKTRIKRRFFSLYMPLVIFNIGYLALFYAMYRINPNASFFTTSTRIDIRFASAGLFDYVNAITGIIDNPVAFQFWFVRDLFVSVLVSPIFWLALRYAPFLCAAIFCAIWLYGYNMEIFLRSDVPFFFYLGGLVRTKNMSLTIPLRITIGLFAIFVVFAGMRAFAPYMITLDADGHSFWLDLLTRIMRIVGVLGCWGMIYRAAQTKLGKHLSIYGGLAFFLHSAHWPMLAVVKVVVWKFVPAQNDLWMIMHLITSVTTTIAIGLAMGILLARFFPRLFSLMNGGRLLTQ
jgi:hypothetical protein